MPGALFIGGSARAGNARAGAVGLLAFRAGAAALSANFSRCFVVRALRLPAGIAVLCVFGVTIGGVSSSTEEGPLLAAACLVTREGSRLAAGVVDEEAAPAGGAEKTATTRAGLGIGLEAVEDNAITRRGDGRSTLRGEGGGCAESALRGEARAAGSFGGAWEEPCGGCEVPLRLEKTAEAAATFGGSAVVVKKEEERFAGSAAGAAIGAELVDTKRRASGG